MAEEEFIKRLYDAGKSYSHFPDRNKLREFTDHLFELMFSVANKNNTLAQISDLYFNVKSGLADLLSFSSPDLSEAKEHAELFFSKLPFIYETLSEDAKAVLEFDPAAHSIEEVLTAYPGFYAIAVYRIAHQLHQQNIPILPRLATEYAHSKTGIDIHPGARIGRSFFIDHGTGIVIGETSVIGNNVKIYQGVTLGALNVSKGDAQMKRHPTIENNVVIYSGATILGGNTTIGHSSVIGGNVWLTESVPPYSVVYHKSDIKIRDNNRISEGLNFVI